MKTIPKSVLILLAASLIAFGMASCRPGFTPPPGETEAKEYLGTELTPIREQRNNAIMGTQRLDRETYRLTVDGMVNSPLSLTYLDLQSLPAESRLVTLNCVEGWSFVAKWTGPTLASMFQKAGLKPGVRTAIFHTSDSREGFTSLDLDYILGSNIIVALKLNDITMPEDRGFPFQVVAEGKFGYKWAKWVQRIELSGQDFRGYWEKEGYNNNADINGPSFENF